MSHSSRPSSSAGSPLDSAAAPVHITQQTQQTQQRGGKVSEFIDLVKDKISAKRKKPIATQDPPKPKRDALKKFKNLRRKNSKAPPIDDREDKDNLHQAFREYSGLPEIDEDRKANEVLKILAPEPSSEPHTSLAPADEPPPSSHLYVRRPSKFSMAARPLPDPATLFDTLLKAGEEDWKPHDNGLSGMTYAIATIISLSLVRTNPENVSYNDASPYLDLAPLYGPNDEELDLIRLNDGSGKLSPDAFYEDTNNILFTPAAAVLLILLNRYHNSIAETLLSKNERGTWRDPSTFFDDAEEFVNYEVEKQDNEIFEIARSMTCIQFKNIVMEDVLKGLLGVSPVGGCVNLDILADADGIRKPGAGYQSSVESSLLYNWFGLMSSDDINYVSTTLRDRLPYKAIDEITIDDVKRAQASMLLDSDRTRRDVAGMRRNEDGYFNDADLARVLHSATEARAGASCSKRVASCLRAWQLELVQQSRNWEVCTLNEYRASLGLKPLKSFEEWSADDAVRRSAAHHYGEIKNLELYPGLQAESGIPGDGLQLGYTMSFGLSSDLVSVVRSDPRFTTDFNEDKLTSWGYKDSVEKKGSKGAFGAMLPQVLFRTLPLYYPFASIYSLFPMVVPSQSEKLLKGVPNSKQFYDFKKPQIQEDPIQRLTTEDAIKEVLTRHDVFASPYAADLRAITDGYGYLLGFDAPELELHDKDQMLTMCSLIPDKGALSRYQRYYRQNLAQILTDIYEKEWQKEQPSPANPLKIEIDLVQDLISVACLRWVCDHLCGSGDFINIKTMEPKKLQQVFEQLNSLYAFASGMVDSSAAWEARENAIQTIEGLKKQIDQKLPPRERGMGIREAMNERFGNSWQRWSRVYTELLHPQGRQVQPEVQTFLHRIFRLSTSIKIDDLLFTDHHLQEMRTRMFEQHRNEKPYNLNLPSVARHVLASRIQAHVDDDIDRIRMISNVCGLVILASSKLAHVASLAVSVYLRKEYEAERKEIIGLCKREVSDGLEDGERQRLLGYIQEAQRLFQNLSVCRIATRDHVIQTREGPIHIRRGMRVQACLTEMHRAMDLNINPIREQPSSLQGMGLHKCPALGKPGKGKPGFLDTVLPEIFISIFSLDNIQGIETQTMSMTQSDLSLGPRHSKIPTPVVPFSITADFTVNPDDKPFTKLRHMRDRSIMAIPRSAPTTRKGWDPKRLRTVKMLNKLGVDVQFLFKAIVVIVVLIFLWHVLSLLLGTSSSIVKWVFISFFSIFRAIFSFLFAFLWSKAYIPKVNLDAPVQYKHVDCPAPIDLIHTWELESFNLTSSGTPTALHYTLDLERAHRLSVIDADKRDTIMRIIVDDEVRGLTRDFELDKTVDCGVDNYRNCLKAHSAGFVIIEKGKHSVTVEYAGKEFLDRDAYTVNWEGEKQRRIFWKREKCGS